MRRALGVLFLTLVLATGVAACGDSGGGGGGGDGATGIVGGRTPNGTRVGPVYTPPEHRGHGYASALVAAASQAQLDEGIQFCFLFTDLANPTANHIYQAIGYEPVSDIDVYVFG